MIRRKKEIPEFINGFETYANWDGKKYYLTLDTINPKGTLTLMKYPNGEFTYHRKNENYWDIKEIKMDNDILMEIIWVFRKSINNLIKIKVC